MPCLFRGFVFEDCFCWSKGAVLLTGLCDFTTGATVAVAFGFAGGFLLTDFALFGDSSDSEE